MGYPHPGRRFQNEQPVHKVCLDGFYMGLYEVTLGEYRHFMAHYTHPSTSSNTAEGAALPVVNVNWREARAFARWLTGKNGAKYLFRLPTEAQWEYACRAEGRLERFHTDNESDSCRYANLSRHFPHFSHAGDRFEICDDRHPLWSPVGTYRPNGWGVYDMIGNVWEWCRDTYDLYAYVRHPEHNPVILEGADYKVIRGGSWLTERPDARCSKRKYTSSEVQMDNIGFRLVMHENSTLPVGK